MVEPIVKWIRKYYNKFVHSIAFLPAIMGLVFLIVAALSIEMDSAGVGAELNKKIKWLTLKDASTARTIVATVAAGIISLVVFSFSMVMIVMNQAASQMSNRMLDNIIGDKTQKIILGFYVGTIVFALFLLTHISETDVDVQVPSLSVYLLLFFTVLDIFLFIYFLHYITQSFRYEQLIKRIHHRTGKRLDQLYMHRNTDFSNHKMEGGQLILSKESGYYQSYDENRLMVLAKEHDIVIEFMHPRGTHVLKNTPLLKMYGKVNEELISKLFLDIDFYYGQEIDKNAYYGFFHLTEVAVKALSPGINDPGTAVLSINALTDLLSTIMLKPIANEIKDDEGKLRIITKQISFEELFENTIMPIWDYGKKDRGVRAAIKRVCNQLKYLDKEKLYHNFLNKKVNEIELNES